MAGSYKKRFVFVSVSALVAVLAFSMLASAGAKSLSEAIAKATWFQDLKSEEKELLKSVSKLRHMKAGEKITEQGKPTKKIYIVPSGTASVLVDGKQIATLSGEFIVGEIEFLDMSPASADVVIQQETDIIEIENLALYSLMDKEPRIGYVLMAELARLEAERLRQTNIRWSKVGS